MHELLFPFAESWWLYAGFVAFVLGLLALDLGVFHKQAHVVSLREAATWSVVWVSLALLFNAGLYFFSLNKFGDPLIAKQVALEFLSGFVVEKALAVDNVFVFIMVFSYFGIPAKYQHRVLFYGILGALVMRGAFIALGAQLMKYHAVTIVFGVFLIITGVKMLLVKEKDSDPEKNPVLRLVRKLMPVSKELHGDRFFVRQDGAMLATPLFLALVFLELSDVIFAVDSVPAIFALTKEPLIVFTSNIFAILGLRALYFLLAGVIDQFRYLKVGLAFVLVFVGVKMSWLNAAWDGKFPISWSLGIIAGILTLSILASRYHREAPR